MKGGAGAMLFSISFPALLGLFCLWHAWRDTDWFFRNSKAAFWVNLVGRDGARWFYGVLGFFLLFMSLVIAMDRL